MAAKVLIIGGGYAGVEAALTLNKLKKKKKVDLEITLVDKNDYHTLLTELHEVAGNRIAEDGIIIKFDRIFKYTDVNYITDEIVSFDFDNKKVHSNTRTFEYDHLIMAMGSKPNFYGIEGMVEHSFTLWSYEDALKIRENIYKCFAMARQEDNEEERRRLLTFAVAGAGFTGVEMIGEIAVWVKKLCKDYGIDRSEVRLILVDLLPRILNTMSEKNATKAHKYMEEKLGIEIILNSAINAANERGFITKHGLIPTATFIWACGVSAAEIPGGDLPAGEQSADGMGNGCFKSGRDKRIFVDEHCQTRYEGVFCVGDMSGFKGDQEVAFPAMVENAIQSAHGVAVNIINDELGLPREAVKVTMHGAMVCIGRSFAVSDIMGKEFGRFMSVVMKFMVNMHYLWEIVGFTGVFNYLYHEFLESKQSKKFCEQNFSVRNQTWWMVPARMFMGILWVYSGIEKILGGWLNSSQLKAMINGTNSWYDSLISEVGQAASDAVSSATGGAGGEAAKVLVNSGWSWLKLIVIKADDIAIKLQFGPMDWFMNKFVTGRFATMGTTMQWFMVLAEIIIGAFLITGSFTFLSGGMSIILLLSFLMTTGLYLQGQMWMLFVAFALMAGAGRAFGMDRYIMPYLNNYWERGWKSKRWTPVFKRSLDKYDRN